MGRLYADRMMRFSLHRRLALHRLAARVLAALLLLALVAVPPLALAVPAGVAVTTMQGGHAAAEACATRQAGGPGAAVRPAMPGNTADTPCKTRRAGRATWRGKMGSVSEE